MTNRFVVLSSDDEEEWVPPTFTASSGADGSTGCVTGGRDVHSRGVPDYG